jgi:hypothetical protein
MSTANHVRHVNLHSAEEFLNAISPRSTYLEGALDRFSHYFIFRGHADDRWKLVPKALRLSELLDRPLRAWGRVKRVLGKDNHAPTEEFFTKSNGSSGEPWTNRDQVASEWTILKTFSR